MATGGQRGTAAGRAGRSRGTSGAWPRKEARRGPC